MKVVSVINYKGGVGKTSLSANLSSEIAFRGRNILLIDLDPQASLTFSFIYPELWESDLQNGGTIKDWFESFSSGNPIDLHTLPIEPKRVNDFLKSRAAGKLKLIASHLGLINVDLELATDLGGANLTQTKRNFLKVHRRLLDGLSELEDSLGIDAPDIVIIDCPPNFNIVTKTAIIASDFILVPAIPDYLSTLGIDYLIRNVNQLTSEYNEFLAVGSQDDNVEISPKLVGVVFTLVQEYGGRPISAQRTYMRQTTELSGIDVFQSYVKRNSTVFGSAPETGFPVVLRGYANGSHASVVEGLEKVTDEFLEKIDGK